jgi:cytochrome c oxidase cbb3-type subunit 3
MCSHSLEWLSAPVVGLSATLLIIFSLASCEREKRQFDTPPSSGANTQSATQAALSALRLGEIQPGTPIPARQVKNKYEENAYAVSQGKKMFQTFNCAGCHAQGGGGSGPALMDDKWIYGSEPIQIYATIAQGRPNGMPSFAGHIPDEQMWQIVAYVRFMSGQLRSDVAPSRSDSLQASKPEQRREQEEPKASSLPKSSEQ